MRKRMFTILLGAAALGVIGVGAVGANDYFKQPPQGALDAEQHRSEAAREALRQGKGRPVGAGQDHWVVIWKNCRFNFIRELIVPTEVDSPGSPEGKMIFSASTATAADWNAQIAPPEPGCVEGPPSQEALNAALAEQSRRNGSRPAPAGITSTSRS